MKKKTQITNRTILFTAVIGSLLVMAMVTALSLWNSQQTISATDEAVSAVSSFYLETMAEQRAKIVTNLINSDFNDMEKAIAYIKEESQQEDPRGIQSQDQGDPRGVPSNSDIQSRRDLQEYLRGRLGMIRSLLSLNRFALVDEDNIVYTEYTTYSGRSRHAFLAEEEMAERTISTVSVYGSSRQLCLAIATPGLKIMGKPFKACFIQLDVKEVVDLLAPDDEGRTYFAVYTKNGANLSGTELGPVISDYNFFDATADLVSKEVWEENVSNFENEQKGSMTFTSDGLKETLYYVPIQGPGWELVVSIRESVIQDQFSSINQKNLESNHRQILFTFLAVLLLAVILLMQVRAVSKDKLEKEKATSRAYKNMANTDSMTGVRNKHAYSAKETLLDQKIQKKEIKKLAIVVCDINGLKYVNDTQGHAAGDQLIKDACELICDNFKHGAVYRVGGDEFAVILEGKGFDLMHESIRKLDQIAEENIEKDEVVVAVGYSVFREEDTHLNDVFERADQMMYERKKQLKEMGAHTRDL